MGDVSAFVDTILLSGHDSKFMEGHASISRREWLDADAAGETPQYTLDECVGGINLIYSDTTVYHSEMEPTEFLVELDVPDAEAAKADVISKIKDVFSPIYETHDACVFVHMSILNARGIDGSLHWFQSTKAVVILVERSLGG